MIMSSSTDYLIYWSEHSELWQFMNVLGKTNPHHPYQMGTYSLKASVFQKDLGVTVAQFSWTLFICGDQG